MKWSNKLIAIGVAVLIIVFISTCHSKNKQKNDYKTAEVKRGDLLIIISATGTVEPEEVVDVGAQVAGRINSFGQDKDGNTIDYGSVVEQGTILAKIDDSLYTADVALASAQLQEADAKLYQAQRDWDRAEKLGPSEALAESSYDAYKSAFEIAKANVVRSQATLDRAKRNLDYCTIKSPVNGVIIDRRVNIGQTVVSSLNAPSLFLIAKDLKHMQVWVAVNETDIGQICIGQTADFTIDAFPGEVFKGTVGKIRYNATMTQNVVTYTVEVLTDNSSGKLFPYLTANVLFEVSKNENVLLVPNAALRWSPKSDDLASADEKKYEPLNSTDGCIWVLDDGDAKSIKVTVGKSDGTKTEISGNGVSEGLLVITGKKQMQTDKTATTNPFVPQIRKGRK